MAVPLRFPQTSEVLMPNYGAHGICNDCNNVQCECDEPIHTYSIYDTPSHLKVACADCGADMGVKPAEAANGEVSHSICADCAAKDIDAYGPGGPEEADDDDQEFADALLRNVRTNLAMLAKHYPTHASEQALKELLDSPEFGWLLKATEPLTAPCGWCKKPTGLGDSYRCTHCGGL